MSRLPGALLAAWLAVLGGAVPAFACAAPGSAGGCCPDSGSAPCRDSEPAVPAGTPAACCAAVPGPAQAAASPSAPTGHERLTDPGSPDQVVLPCLATTFAHAVAAFDGPCDSASQPASDASLTYLRTLRLRL